MAFYEWSEDFEAGTDGGEIPGHVNTIFTSAHAHTGVLSATQTVGPYWVGSYPFVPTDIPPDGPNDSECEAWFYTVNGGDTERHFGLWHFLVYHGWYPTLGTELSVTFFARRRDDTGDLVVRVINDGSGYGDDLSAEVTIPYDTWIRAHFSINTGGTLYRATVTDDLGTVYIDASGPVWVDTVPPFHGIWADMTNDGYGNRVYIDDLSVVIGGLHYVRLFPRDDGLGLSSAPRIFPPPKSRRVVGGYQ